MTNKRVAVLGSANAPTSPCYLICAMLTVVAMGRARAVTDLRLAEADLASAWTDTQITAENITVIHPLSEEATKALKQAKQFDTEGRAQLARSASSRKKQ